MTVHPRDIRRAVAQNGSEATARRAADEAEAGLAKVIGEAVALHLADLLPKLLTLQPACVLCCAQAKQAEATGAKPPPIAQSVTVQPIQVNGAQQIPLPVCWQHFETGPQVRSTGLVNPSGQPILAHGQ